MSFGFRFLKQLGIKVAAESITREALIRELKDSTDNIINTTVGSVARHASLTIYSQELTVFLGYNNQQLMADLADWYDCRDQWTYRTKNMGTDDIEGVWVNLFGATTPELLQTTLPRDAVGGGLTSRMLFVYEQKKSKMIVYPCLSKEQEVLEVSLQKDLDRISMMSGEFKVTEEFIELWATWYTETERKGPKFDDYRFAGYVERRPTHMLKLCIIISASRSDARVIDGSDFKRALGILEMTEVRMPFTFSGMGKYKDSDVMNRIMTVVATYETISLTDLQRKFYQDIDKTALENILATMKQMQFIDTVYDGSETKVVFTDFSNHFNLR